MVSVLLSVLKMTRSVLSRSLPSFCHCTLSAVPALDVHVRFTVVLPAIRDKVDALMFVPEIASVKQNERKQGKQVFFSKFVIIIIIIIKIVC